MALSKIQGAQIETGVNLSGSISVSGSDSNFASGGIRGFMDLETTTNVVRIGVTGGGITTSYGVSLQSCHNGIISTERWTIQPLGYFSAKANQDQFAGVGVPASLSGFGQGSAEGKDFITFSALANIMYASGTEVLRATPESRVLVGTAVSNIIGSNLGGAVAKTFVYQTAANNEWISAFRHDAGIGGNGVFIRAGNDDTTYSLYCTPNDESKPILVARGDQRLGIGTTNPADILDVSQPSPSGVTDFYFRNPAAAGGSKINVVAQESITGILAAADSGNVVRIGSTSAHATQIIANDEVKIHIATDGQPAKVAIGTDSISSVLDFIGQPRPFTVHSHDDATSPSGSKTALVIGQNSTVTGSVSQLSFAAKSDSTYSNNNLYSSATIACSHGARTAGQYHSGQLIFFVSPGSNIAPGERMRLTDDGYLKVQSNGSSYGGGTTLKAHDFTSDHNDSCVRFYTANGSYSDGMFMQRCSRAATSAYSFAFWESSSGSDREFNFRGDGNAYADGSFNGGGADYAEYFEWNDGNPNNEDRRGMTVVLIDNKIGIATTGNSSDEIIGVVSSNPVVVGDMAGNKWHNKHLRDDLGSYIWDNHELLTWYVDSDEVATAGISTLGISTTYVQKKVQYESWNIPDGVIVPSVGVARTSYDEDGNILKHRRLNPNWDPDQEYVPREYRQEWDAIGMVGKLRILKGQQTGSRWIKMRDVSESVEEWLVR